mgnify:CR=1 FL=1
MSNRTAYESYLRWHEYTLGDIDDPMTYTEWEAELWNIGIDQERSGE